jgi:hypothetical protein
MTLFETPQVDPSRHTRLMRGIAIALACCFLGFLAVEFGPKLLPSLWYWSEQRIVDHFFAALQQQDYEKAYGIWNHDPDWKQHPQKYSNYPFQEFMKDWGPGSEWGLIKSYHVDGSAVPKGGNGTTFDVGSSGIVVVVTVNERVAQKAHIWVEKSDKTLGFSPY